MNVPLSVMMIDVTERPYDIDSLREKCALMSERLSDEKTFEEMKML